MLKAVLGDVVKRAGVDVKEIGDVVIGNCQMSGSYSGPARTAQLRAGFPYDVPIYAVNRQCSSGLQAIASVYGSIRAGFTDSGIGAGVESMTSGGGVAPGTASTEIPPINLEAIMENQLAMDALLPMGITSENVAERYGITRQEQDQMAVESHAKALAAQKAGHFMKEIVAVTTVLKDKDGSAKEIVVNQDEGPRAGTTMDGLAKLKPAFKPDGSTTAGNASQVSDGAAAVLLMKRSKANRLGLPIMGVFRGYQVVGVPPSEMGIGPAYAIPAVLKQCGLTNDDIDVFEINEAFASQAVYCVKKAGIDMSKVNPNGGAIALGHPLGSTGARQVTTLLHELHRSGKKLGVVSMCIGTGMGAAAVVEAE